MSAVFKLPMNMTVPEFVEWCPDDGQRWELVDGAPRAMAPAKIGHNQLVAETIRLIGNHLATPGSPCSVMAAAGVVPHVRAGYNFRVPDIAVACTRENADDLHVSAPVLLVEVLSPSNQSDTWSNVWAHCSIPSVREILVLHSLVIRAEVLRRTAEGNWPKEPEIVTFGDLVLESIGFSAPIASVYRTTPLGAR
jgi:Uma2 family endonuclease